MSDKEDYYWEAGKLIFTEQYHLNRGYCCGSKCRNCPYFPKYQNGNSKTKK